MKKMRRDVTLFKWPQYEHYARKMFLVIIISVFQGFPHPSRYTREQIFPPLNLGNAIWLPVLRVKVLRITSEKWCRLLVLCAPLPASLKNSQAQMDPGGSSWVISALESHWGSLWIFQECAEPWDLGVLSLISPCPIHFKNMSDIELSRVRREF